MEDKIVLKEIRSAIKQGNLDKVKELVSCNTTLINAMTPFGSWLHIAASYGKVDIIKYFLGLGADVNIIGGVYKGNALNEASTEGQYEVAKYLIANGAQIDVSEPTTNPLFGAILSGNIEIVKLLIESGINTKVKYTGDNMTEMDAYAFAIERGEEKIAALLKAI